MQLGLFSVSYAGGWGQQRLTCEEFVARAGALGYGAVMIAGKRPHVAPLDADESALDRLTGTLRRHQIACGALAAYTDFSPARAVEVPFLEMQIDYVTQLARIAARLGALLVRVFTAYSVNDVPAVTQWERVVACLRECCDRAAEHGVTLAVQNHHDVALPTEALIDLVSEVERPNCRLGFDAWSPALRGEDLYAAARRAAPLTAMTTNADYVRWPRFAYEPQLVNYRRVEPDFVRAVPFGEGFIDYPAFFRGLRDGGFDGLANYEMCSPIRGGGAAENLDRYARQYVAWMQEHGFANSRIDA